jgi:hypothetical protein
VPFTLVGSITAIPAGSEIVVTRVTATEPDGVEFAKVTTSATGAFSFTDTYTVEGYATYTVSYRNELGYMAATDLMQIWCYRLAVSLSLNRDRATYAYGKKVLFTAKLGKTATNRVVEIWADPDGSDLPNRLLKKGPVDSAGKFSASIRLTRNTTLQATFAGDAVYGPSVAFSEVYTRVAVSTKVTKHYKTKKIGANTYYVVRTTKDPRFTTTMTAQPRPLLPVRLQALHRRQVEAVPDQLRPARLPWKVDHRADR